MFGVSALFFMSWYAVKCLLMTRACHNCTRRSRRGMWTTRHGSQLVICPTSSQILALIFAECRSLIHRMLQTDPTQRLTLTEIMNHPWITKGFNSPPENYLPQREPVQLPLDKEIIDKMTGFDFGTAEYITAQLTNVVQSEEYQRAIKLASRRGVIPYLAKNS
jgi:serine/threonine protein kinase